MEEIQLQPQGELVPQGRKILMFFSQEGKKKNLVSNAKTWGELQAEHPEMDFRKKEVVTKEGRHTLKVDAAELPTGDFTLFVYPQESKSGLSDAVKNLGYNKGRSVASHLNKFYDAKININGTKDSILSYIDVALAKNSIPLSRILTDMDGKKKAGKKLIGIVEKVAEIKKDNLDPIAKKPSVKEKLAKKMPDPTATNTYVDQTLVKEEIKSERPGNNAFITPPPQYINVELNVRGLDRLADAIMYAENMQTVRMSSKSSEFADKLAQVMSLDLDQKLKVVTLTKEEEEKKIKEAIEKARAKEEAEQAEKDRLAKIEKDKLEEAERIRQAEIARQKEKEEDDALAREAQSLGRELRR